MLKQKEAEEKTKSGIILASSAQEKPELYEVIEVGPGGMVDGNEVVMSVKKGQTVLVGQVQRHQGQDRRGRAHDSQAGRHPCDS